MTSFIPTTKLLSRNLTVKFENFDIFESPMKVTSLQELSSTKIFFKRIFFQTMSQQYFLNDSALEMIQLFQDRSSRSSGKTGPLGRRVRHLRPDPVRRSPPRRGFLRGSDVGKSGLPSELQSDRWKR